MIVTWSIINNEEDYLKDIIEHHLPWVDAMYFLDTGSTDSSLDILKEYKSNKLYYEEYHTKYTPQYDVPWEQMTNPFPEVEVRNFAIKRCQEIFKPDWLIQLDGDEIFLPTLKPIIEKSSNGICITHSTINPVCELKHHNPERRGGYILYDPHARIWNSRHKIEYINNPNIKTGQFHCIPVFRSDAGHKGHIFNHPLNVITNSPIHFHLHWMYGKKLEMFYAKQGIIGRKEIAKGQPTNVFSNLVPQVFWDKREQWIQEIK